MLRGYTARWTDEGSTREPRSEHRHVRTVGWFRGARLYRWATWCDAEMHTRNTTVDCTVGAAA